MYCVLSINNNYNYKYNYYIIIKQPLTSLIGEVLHGSVYMGSLGSCFYVSLTQEKMVTGLCLDFLVPVPPCLQVPVIAASCWFCGDGHVQ